MRFPIRALIAPTLLVLAAGGGRAQAQQVVRIAYVNPQALFAAAPGRAEAQAAFEKDAAGYRSELTKMSDALTAMVTDYTKNEATLPAAEKTKRQARIQAKEDSLRSRQAELEQVANERQGQLMAPIMEAVKKVLEDIRVEDGFAMILSAEPGASPILAADKNLDITERVVARLRTLAAVKPATKAPGAPAATPSGVTRPKPPGE